MIFVALKTPSPPHNSTILMLFFLKFMVASVAKKLSQHSFAFFTLTKLVNMDFPDS
ncbi:hypothetical protein TKO01_06950 [Tetragenococcus koreensis]|nr:hypothetical protein TKO01_06950 [Tetragenococcus koreensis]